MTAPTSPKPTSNYHLPVAADIAAIRARIDDRVEQSEIGYGETALAQALHDVLTLVEDAHREHGSVTGRQIRDAIREGLEA